MHAHPLFWSSDHGYLVEFWFLVKVSVVCEGEPHGYRSTRDIQNPLFRLRLHWIMENVMSVPGIYGSDELYKSAKS